MTEYSYGLIYLHGLTTPATNAEIMDYISYLEGTVALKDKDLIELRERYKRLDHGLEKRTHAFE